MDEDTIIKERKKFYADMMKLFKSGKFKSAKKIKQNSIIVTTRQEDFDYDTNLIWQTPENKSYPVDEVCEKCKKPVVMSGGMFKMLIEAKETKKKVRIFCNQCLSKEMKKHKVKDYFKGGDY